MKILIGARHGLNLSGKLQRIAEQEKALLQKMKTKPISEVFKQPTENGTSSKKAQKRPLDLNNSKDESSDDDDKLPINLESFKEVSKTRKKKGKRQVNELADIMLTVALDKSQSQESVTTREQESIVHQDTPIKKRKRDKSSKKESDELNKIVEEIEQIDEARLKRKKKKKSKNQTNMLDDDETMPDVAIKKPDSSEDVIKAKRARIVIDSAAEVSNSSDEDIDKINEIHHINLHNTKLAANELRNKNYENSSKKKKKKKGKTMAISDDNWKITHKKMEKSDAKKLKLKLKQEKLAKEEPQLSKKERKKQRKEKRKEFAKHTDSALTELTSVL